MVEDPIYTKNYDILFYISECKSHELDLWG